MKNNKVLGRRYMNRYKGQNTGKKMSKEKNEKRIPAEESKGIVAMNKGRSFHFLNLGIAGVGRTVLWGDVIIHTVNAKLD